MSCMHRRKHAAFSFCRLCKDSKAAPGVSWWVLNAASHLCCRVLFLWLGDPCLCFACCVVVRVSRG